MNKLIPNLSVDCVVFGFDKQNLNVLLKKRQLKSAETGEMLVDDYTLTGYHVFEGEDLDTAAQRTLYNVTGLKDIYLEQFFTFGNTDRLTAETDKNWINSLDFEIAEHVISVGYLALVDSTKVKPDSEHPEVFWMPVSNLPALGFDHKNILDKALERLRMKVRLEPIGFELLPDKFTLREMQEMYECILGITFDKRNFRKKVSQMKYVIQLDEKQHGVAHKPAQKFIFSRDVYDRTRTEKLNLFI